MKNSQAAFNVLFSKQRKIFSDALGLVTQEHSQFGKNSAIAFTLQANIEPLGFSFSKDTLISLSHQSDEALATLWENLLPQMKLATGSSKSFKPMYPNFPEQVLSADKQELMLNAFMHYAGSWIGLRVLPEYTAKVRLPLVDKVEPKLVEICTLKDSKELFFNLISANSSLSESDKANVSQLFSYLNENKMAQEFIEKSNISQKENLAFVGNLVLQSDLDFNNLMAHQFDTPTDVLRLCAAMFGGDVSLAKPLKVGKLSRPMRKALMATLERQLINTQDKDQLVENFFTYREMWVRVGHALHVGEHANKFPMLAGIFKDLRDNNKPVTFNSQVEELISSSKIDEATQLLVTRPGVFARHLNRLLGSSSDIFVQSNVLNKFSQTASSVSTPVLLQLHSHFLNQHEKTVRSFMPKGGLSKLFVSEAEHKPLDKKLAMQIAQICDENLVERFKSFPDLGNVYVDESLKLQNVPFAQRSSSKSLASVARGSRFDVEQEEKETIRLFLWWNENGLNKEGKPYTSGRVDIDLSCVIMDKNYKEIEVCSYFNLYDYSGEGAFAHSGDIVSAPNGACEFIDINLKKLSPEARYIVMTISSYTQQKYCDLPECFAGWMMREKPQAGEIFDARTVKNKVDLTSESTQMMPAIFDIEKNQFIWADIAIKASPTRVNNIHNNMSGIGYNVKAIVNMVKPNLYDLFMFHAKARGNLVNRKEQADTIFSNNEGITPYMFDKIASEFMADKAPQLIEEAKPKVTVKKKLNK